MALWQVIWARDHEPGLTILRPRDFLVRSSMIACLVLSISLLVPAAGLSSGSIPGEEQAGILFTITHLHPVAYVILFVVFLLSVLNLVHEGRFSRVGRMMAAVAGSKHTPDAKARGSRSRTARSPTPGAKAPKRLIPGPKPDFPVEEADEGRIVGKPRVVNRAGAATAGRPTPLDGVNHPLPSLSAPEMAREGEAKSREDKQEPKIPRPHQFRFTSAVDLLSPEEIEKREKEKLVVIGAVRGPDVKGIGSVIVYLANESGNRIGQSCLSLPETGEFKVLSNQPGRYTLHGHKRGYVMEQVKPEVLPIESGKIEGYSLRMVPEGCVVHGTVTFDEKVDPLPEIQVHCVVEGSSFSGSGRMGPSGAFMIYGVPRESRCVLEARAANGDVLASSDPFETGQEKYLTRNVLIPGSAKAPHPSQDDCGHQAAWNNHPAGEKSPSASPSAGPLGHA